MQEFYICKHCGNLIVFLENSGVPVVCCGQEMNRLSPNTSEASAEKHLPVVSISGESVRVRVGSAPHPMEDAHNIAFVYLATARGGQRKHLKAGDEPGVEFALADDEPIAIYAYCNLHGLWMTKV